MIVIRFEISDDGNALILDISGHAEQNDIGKDIVCSAASMLTYTLAQYVTDMYADKKLKKSPKIKLKEGNASIVCIPRKAFYDEILYTFCVITKGYQILAHHYPMYVQFRSFDMDN